MKFTLTCDDGYTKVTHEFENEYLYDVIEKIELFLKGVGFIIDGKLIVEDKPSLDEFKIDLTGFDDTYDEPGGSAFDPIIREHEGLLDLYPNMMTVDLTGSSVQTEKTPCSNYCNCGKSNAK
jgi:hypothetical protein